MSFASHATPNSLPSDYAILSRFSQATESALTEEEDSGASSDDDEHSHSHSPNDTSRRRSRLRSPRRLSFPTPYITPPQPLTGPLPTILGAPTEVTPLLGPPVPRITEDFGGHHGFGDNESSIAMFWEELRVLSRYTLPVFR